ncbi:MAG: serine/threonine-protein kinase [Planctomycetota bacterium]
MNVPGSKEHGSSQRGSGEHGSSEFASPASAPLGPVDPHPGEDADTVIRRGDRGQAAPAGDDSPRPGDTTGRRSGSGSNRPAAPPPPSQSPSAIAAVLLGHRLNQFRLDELIGGGGMGAVFRAHDEQLDRTVAVKVVPFAAEDPERARRFKNEAQTAARLDHPRIAKVFEVGTDGRWHFIVFEFIRGTNLRDLVIRDGVLSIDDAVYYTMQLADALSHVDQRGITHRDVKPSNVVLSEGRIKLVDMGLARSESVEVRDDLTASGVTLGTFDYISPEQAKDPRDADLRSDLYSLGCTLYFLLIGKPPYPGGTMLQKLLAHGSGPVPDPRELRAEISETLSMVIRRMLAKDPADRYQNAEALIADLRDVARRDQLRRSRSAGPVVESFGGRIHASLERYAPWTLGITVLLGVAVILKFQETTRQDSFRIPTEVKRPAAIEDVLPSVRPRTIPAQGGGLLGESVSPGSTASLGNPAGQTTPGTGSLAATNGSGASNGDAGPSLGGSDGNKSQIADRPIANNLRDAGGGLDAATGVLTDADILQRGGMNSNGDRRASESVPTAVSGGGKDFEGSRDFEGGGDFEDGSGVIDPLIAELAGLRPSTVNSNATGDANFSEASKRPIGDANDPLGESGTMNIERDRLAVPNNVSDLPSIDPGRVPNAVLVKNVSPAAGAATIDSEDRLIAASLEQAIRWARALGLRKVLLGESLIRSGPLRIEMDDLSIRSIAGGTVVLIDDSVTRGDAPAEQIENGVLPRNPDRRVAVIDASVDRLEFEGVKFVWRIPKSHRGATSLLRYSGNRSLNLTGCAITIDNATIRDNIHAIELNRPGGERLGEVVLRNVVVRGEMTLLHLRRSEAFSFRWFNGLLAISNSMIDANGAEKPPQDGDEIQLDLERVTTDCPGGLMRMRLSSMAPVGIPVTRMARSCLFLIRDAAPQFEFLGLDDLSEPRQWLLMRGSNNGYRIDPGRFDPLMRLETGDGARQTLRFDELVDGNADWIDETGWVVQPNWAGGGRPIGPTTSRRVADYRLEQTELEVGFDERTLPTLTAIEFSANPIPGGSDALDAGF